MSTPILPFATWATGTNSNATPANDNSLRSAILNGLVISESTDAQPGSPDPYDIYIITGAATGAQWSTFDQFDLAIFDGAGTWHAYAPVEGIVVNVAGTLKRWNGSAYVDAAAGSGVASVNGRTGAVTLTASDVYSTIVTDSTTARNLDADDMGKYLRFTNAGTKNLTVQDNADEAITAGAEVHGRNVGAGDLTIVEDTAVTVNPPAGGTLVIPQGGTFTLKKVATDEWDLFGVTVAA